MLGARDLACLLQVPTDLGDNFGFGFTTYQKAILQRNERTMNEIKSATGILRSEISEVS